MRDEGPQGESFEAGAGQRLEHLRAQAQPEEVGFGRSPAVLVVGCQRAFTDPESPLGSSLDLDLRQVRRLLASARRVAVPVLFAVRLHQPGDDADLLLRKTPALAALAPGSEGARIDPRLAPEAEEVRVETRGASAFHGGPLAERLADSEVDTLLLVGAWASDAIRQTAADAAQRGLSVLVPRECVGDRSAEAVDAGLLDVQRLYGDVIEIGEALAYLERAHIESMMDVLEGT